MEPFVELTSVAVPLKMHKVDTGVIFPGRFMRLPRRPGQDYANAFLHDLRFDEQKKPRPDFTLNQDIYREARILVAGLDFGCGSSREGAAYAALDYGLRAIVAMSIAEIFSENCMQNGVLPVTLPEQAVESLWSQMDDNPGAKLTIKLPDQVLIAPDDTVHRFDIAEDRKQRLLEGLGDIDITLQHRQAIAEFEARRHEKYPWLPRLPRTEGPVGRNHA
jgi:3-isopropylmalate/(R)-2-methylmalate dehydratase small subunit